MKIHPSRLEAKVAAVNGANQLANEFVPIILEVSKRFIGEKVMTVEGSLTKKFEKALPHLPGWGHGEKNQNILIVKTEYGLTLSAAFNAHHEKGYYTHSATVRFARIEKGVLASVFDFASLKVDFTPQDVLAFRQNMSRAEEAFRKAEADISPFGRYDY